MRFTYSRTGAALRNQVFSLLLIAGVDLVAWVVAFFVVPAPWGLRVAAGGLLLTGVVYWFLTAVLRTSHALDGQSLRLQMGRHRLAVDLADLNEVRLAPLVLPRGGSPVGVGYWSDVDTLYMLADKSGLVALRFARPYEMKVPDRGLCQFTRVVLSLDEPERFAAALEAHMTPKSEPVASTGAGSGNGLQGAGTLRPAGVTDTPAALPAVESEGAALQLTGLVKRFGGFTAVRGIDLAVGHGEILAFLGSNGAGKSTTIRMVTGLLRPTSGRVLVQGRDLWAEGGAVRRLVGYVPDVPLLHEALTAREFLWLMAGLYGLPEPEGRRRADELLAMVKLERWGDHQIRAFSLGMKRKMAIAAAIVHRPKVLLLDEVTNGLDPRAAREVKDFIAQAAREGAAVLLTTHILSVAEELAQRIAIIHEGEFRAVGDLSLLQEQAGMPGASLEELFLALTGEERQEVGA